MSNLSCSTFLTRHAQCNGFAVKWFGYISLNSFSSHVSCKLGKVDWHSITKLWQIWHANHLFTIGTPHSVKLSRINRILYIIFQIAGLTQLLFMVSNSYSKECFGFLCKFCEIFSPAKKGVCEVLYAGLNCLNTGHFGCIGLSEDCKHNVTGKSQGDLKV